jgi:hypothetical protein
LSTETTQWSWPNDKIIWVEIIETKCVLILFVF